MSVTKEELENLNEKFSGENCNKMYSSGLLFDTGHNAGARLIMSSAFVGEQWVIPVNPDFPLIYTGYENAFGKYADSITKSEKNFKVISVISKFPNFPRHIYVYVVQDIFTGVFDVIEVKHYESYSESHGYLKPFTVGDLFNINDIIPEGTIISRAPTLDEYGNYCMGVNAKVATVSWNAVEEDGYLVSDEFAKKTKYQQIEENGITINNNIIMINRYGNNEVFKFMPDIGEYVKDGIICSYRELNFNFASSETTKFALSNTIESDFSIPGKGKVIDIDVYINNEDEFNNNKNRFQLMKYWVISKNYHQNILKVLTPIVKNKDKKCSYRLRMLYEKSRDFLNPDLKFTSNNGAFEFAYIQITTAYEDHLKEGSKLTNRAAAKGVITHIIPKSMMPRDKYGNVADIVKCPPGVVGRGNSYQLYEHELNYISFHIRMKMAEAVNKGIDKQFSILFDYLEIIDIEQANELKFAFYKLNEYEKTEFIADAIKNGIRIRLKKDFSVDLYKIMKKLYEKYNIKPDRVRVEFEVTKHGFSEKLLNSIKDNYFGLFKDKDGNILNTFVTPFNINEENEISKMVNEKDYVFKDEFTVLGPDNEPYLVRPNKDNKYEAIKPVYEEKLIDVIEKNWTDETYVTEVGENTYKISVLTEEPVIISDEFFLILKHTPEGKLSARYIGSTSPLGLPNKTSKTETNGPVSGTPIKYGEMELFNAGIRVDKDLVYRHLSIVSKNPDLRSKMCRILLFMDPTTYHNLPDPVTDVCDDISAKILNAYNFCLGIEVMDREEDDIYTPFDDYDLSDEEILDVILKQKEDNPDLSLNII